jgi:hypothetical protein
MGATVASLWNHDVSRERVVVVFPIRNQDPTCFDASSDGGTLFWETPGRGIDLAVEQVLDDRRMTSA